MFVCFTFQYANALQSGLKMNTRESPPWQIWILFLFLKTLCDGLLFFFDEIKISLLMSTREGGNVYFKAIGFFLMW